LWEFQKTQGRLPANTEADIAQCQAFAKQINEANKANEGITVESIEEDVVKNAVAFATSCISPMAAFFGGILA